MSIHSKKSRYPSASVPQPSRDPLRVVGGQHGSSPHGEVFVVSEVLPDLQRRRILPREGKNHVVLLLRVVDHGLAEGRSLRDIWTSCYEWTFPYFLVGSAVAGLASAASHGHNLGVPHVAQISRLYHCESTSRWRTIAEEKASGRPKAARSTYI